MKIIKNHAKKLKVYRKNVDFHRPPPTPPKVYGLNTRENVDIYGRPLKVHPTFRIIHKL